MRDDAAGSREAGGGGAGGFGAVGVDDEGAVSGGGAVFFARANAEGGDRGEHGAAVGVRLHDPDILDTEDARGEGCAEADGTTAEDNEARIGDGADHAVGGEADGVPAAGQRLGEGGMGEWGVIGHGDQVARGHGEALGKGALARGDGDEGAVGAQVLAPLGAVEAGAAGHHRVDGDALALHGAVYDRAGSLVAEDEGREAARIGAVEGMHVRPADAHGLDRHDGVAVLGGGVRDGGHFEGVRAGVDECAHGRGFR